MGCTKLTYSESLRILKVVSNNLKISVKSYAGDYRYGFNGMEKDDEVKGEGNSYDFGARQYDSRIGRWLTRDPLEAKYPYFSPYVGIGNNPIMYIDPDGEKIIIPNEEDRVKILNYLNELADGEFDVNSETGEIFLKATTDVSGKSDYYRDQLSLGIQSDVTIEIRIQDEFVPPVVSEDGKSLVDNPYPKKAIDLTKSKVNQGAENGYKGIGSRVYITGLEAVILVDPGDGTMPTPELEAPEFVLMHELIAHALARLDPELEKKSAIDQENIVRDQVGASKRAKNSDHHTYDNEMQEKYKQKDDKRNARKKKKAEKKETK